MSITLLMLLLGSAVGPEDPPAAPPDAAAPVSALVGKLHLGDEPPELRTLATIWLPYAGAEGVPTTVRRTREEALGIAQGLVADLRAGGDWFAASERWSAAKNRGSGSVLGTFPRGSLDRELDAFLFGAEVDQVGDALELARGIIVPKRVETLAACRAIAVRGTDAAARARADEVLGRLRAGEDFAVVARERSDHPGSAARGGAFGIYERGPVDTMIKLAAFRAAVGEVVGPIEVVDSLFIVKRVPPQELAGLVEPDSNWVRVRAVLLAYDGARPGLRPNPRDPLEAMALARDLHARILAGEDMAALARALDDDTGGRERGGDLGWIHRGRPGLPTSVQRTFFAAPGELEEPVDAEIGIALLRRER